MTKNMEKKNITILIIAFLVIIAGTFIYKKSQDKTISPPSSSFIILPPANMEDRYKEDFNKAVEALAKNENDYDALLTIARIRDWSGDPQGAIEIYERMIKIKPDDLLPYFNMGGMYHSLKDYNKAGEMYEKVIEINPKWVNAYKEIFDLYRFKLTNKYDDKIEGLLKEGLEKSKDLGGEGFSDFYAMLGIYYKDKGEKQKAIENFEKILEIDPMNRGAESELNELKNDNN